MRGFIFMVKTSKTSNSRLGFTLVECVATIVLMGIMAFAVAPLLGNANNAMSLDSAAKKLEADIRYAQNMATTTSDTHGFRATSSTTYEVYKKVNGLSTIITSPYNHSPMSVSLATDFDNVTFGALLYPTYVIEFDKTGMPTTGGGTQVTLILPTGESKKVTVTATSGNITQQ